MKYQSLEVNYFTFKINTSFKQIARRPGRSGASGEFMYGVQSVTGSVLRLLGYLLESGLLPTLFSIFDFVK